MDLSRPEPGPADARAWLRLGAVAAGLLAVASDAAALWGDQLEVFLAETVTSDSNVFRRSSAEERDTHTTTTISTFPSAASAFRREPAGTRFVITGFLTSITSATTERQSGCGNSAIS